MRHPALNRDCSLPSPFKIVLAARVSFAFVAKLTVFALTATAAQAQAPTVQEFVIAGSPRELGRDAGGAVISDTLVTLGLPALVEPCVNPFGYCIQAAVAGQLQDRARNAVLIARAGPNPLVLALEGDVTRAGPSIGTISLTDNIFNNIDDYTIKFRTGASTGAGVIFDADVATLLNSGLCVPCADPRVEVADGISSFNSTAFLTAAGSVFLYPPRLGSNPVQILPTSTSIPLLPNPPAGSVVTHLSHDIPATLGQDVIATLQSPSSAWSVYRCCAGFSDKILGSGATATINTSPAALATFLPGPAPAVGPNGGFFATVEVAGGGTVETNKGVFLLGSLSNAQVSPGAITVLQLSPFDAFGEGPSSSPVVNGNLQNRYAAAWLRRGTLKTIERVLTTNGVFGGLPNATPVTVATTVLPGNDGWISLRDPVAVLPGGGAVLIQGDYSQLGSTLKRVAWVDGRDTFFLPLDFRDRENGNPIADSNCTTCNVEVSPVAFEASNDAGAVVYRVTGPRFINGPPTQSIRGMESIPSTWRPGGDASFLKRENWLLGVGPLDRPVGNRKIVFDAPAGQSAELRIGNTADQGYRESVFLDTLTVGGVGDRAGSALLYINQTSAQGPDLDAVVDLQVGTEINVLANGTLTFCNLSSIKLGKADIPGQLTIYPGGQLNGNGTISGNLIYNGIGGPGCSPGTLTVQGTFTQETGDLNFEIGGTAAGQYDVLDVAGETKLLGGIVRVTFINGFTPNAGDTFSLFRAHGGLTIDPSVQYVFTNAPVGFKFAFDPATGTVTVASATTGPDITPNISGTLGTNGWYTSDVTLTWTGTDAASTVTSSSGCDTTSITADTTGTSFTCTATSAGGTTTKSVTIKRDATPPLAQATTLPVPNGAGWNHTDVIVHLSATEVTSGPAICTADQTLSAEGANQSSAAGTCTDLAGNVSAAVTATGINIDKTPPTVSAARSPAAGAGGWSNLPVTVSFTGVDALSTVAANGCTSPVTLSTDGIGLSASGTCTDLAGNSASTTLGDIKIDRIPPGVAAVATPGPNANGWNNTDVTVAFAGTESLSGSGVASCSANVLLSAEGAAQPASGTCTDVAGNTSTARSIAVSIDKTAPTASIAVPNGGTYPQGTIVNASYSCSDPLSSIANCTGTVGNGAPIDTASAGVKSFVVTATDRAGNSSSAQSSYTVTAVTASLPVITPVISGTLGANNWYTSNVSLAWTVTSSTTVTTRNGCNARSITSNTTGVTFTCTATNASGTASQSVTIKRDANPPVTRATATPNANSAGWRRSAVTVSFTGVDNVSGIAICSPATQLTAEGQGQSASGQCTNGAGLSSTATKGDINIDFTPPEVTIGAPTSGAVYARNALVLASFACSDSLSGIQARNGCAGSVPNGGAINTRERGVRTFTVTGRDVAGNATTRSVSYTVQ